MSFSAFIKDNVDALVADWEAFARTLPAARTMSTLALRDHSREILLAVAADMALPLSEGQRVAQSEEIAATPASIGTAAAEHGALRQLAGFDMVQLFAEFRASNAVQHGDRSAPVTLSAVGEADAVVLKVSNMGEPIPPEALQAIFEPLVQAPNASAQAHERSKTSLGLGLFIVREIVLGHGGTVTVESSAEAGTVFTVRLPSTPA